MLRFRQVLFVVLAAVLLAVTLAACGDDDGSPAGETPTPIPEAGDGFPTTLQGSDGRELTLDAPPQRMVVLSPGHVEILFAIGAGDQVVAVDQNSDFPPEAATRLQLSGFEPNLEAIAGLDPDLVIVSFDADGIVGALDNLGIPVYLDDINTKITTVDEVFDSIKELGRITGHRKQAQALINDLQARVRDVVKELRGVNDGPTVYHELDATGGFFSISPDSFVGDLYRTLKAENIVGADEGPFPSLTQEAIIERNPEVIVLANAAFGETPEVVSARPGWDTIDAVINGRVYAIDPNIVSRPGPRIVDALETLARLFYPELFADEGQ